MLKPLLVILVIVILLALVLNIKLPEKPLPIVKPVETIHTSKEVEPEVKQVISLNDTNKTIVKEETLLEELQELLSKAEQLFRKNKDAEALIVYEKVIAKSKNSNDIEILKLFAKACFKQANIHYIYPSYDVDAAIASYRLVIDKLAHSHNKELLLTYMQARIKQAPFHSKDEILTTYDELIEKFSNDKEQRFDKEIEELLFAKSFALMGVDDEEAIEVLDTIITKYDKATKLPETVKYSILNNIELSIITNNDSEKYVALAEQYMLNSPDTKPLLGMLNIIKNAQELDQEEALKEWYEEHSSYKFPDWDFSELRKWVHKMEIPTAKARISDYLDAFEKQKYTNVYQPSIPISSVHEQYADNSTQNEEDQTSAVQEHEAPSYETDPYQTELLNTEAEISYPNPYSTYAPNLETDGASHTYNNGSY